MDLLVEKGLSAILDVDVSFEKDKPVKLNSIKWKKGEKSNFELLQGETFTPLTRSDLSKSCLKGHSITFISPDEDFRMIFNSKRKWFSYSQVFKCILEFEKEVRSREDSTTYCDDLHIFFEGFIQTKEPNTFMIFWGS